MRDQSFDSVEQYEAPKLVVIGAVREFTFGSTHDQSDHSTTGTTGGHRTP
jgi:hypothetical protein